MLTDVDLPAPGLLWARWATIASALTGLGYDDVWFVDESGAHHDNHGGGWARFAVLDGARAVLFGYDRDHSETATADPPVDVLTGAPAWLPWDELIERRVRRLSQDEHNRLVWAAMHDAGELPRPAPPAPPNWTRWPTGCAGDPRPATAGAPCWPTPTPAA